jgi:hypothetical protein
MHWHLCSADLLEIESMFKPGTSYEESCIYHVPLQEIAEAIADDIDTQQWQEVQETIKNNHSINDEQRIEFATADYFLQRDHEELDLPYIFLEKLECFTTIRPLPPGWLNPDPLVEKINTPADQ